MEQVISSALVAVVLLSGVPLVAIALGAGTAALVAACFQVQEASITHLVRLGIFAAVVALLGHAAYHEIEALFLQSVAALVSVRGD